MNVTSHSKKSYIFKVALFATGLSGIVAEYCLATLASYFLYDTVVQWTLTVSTMLFSMGLGSQLSRLIKKNLLDAFIILEFSLSILASFTAVLAYLAAGYTEYHGFVIYSLTIILGILIGMEIPIVTRINEEYEDLKENIASVMAYDYFGSLIGGLFFAFVGLPRLGLTYTPFLLGFINFAVAAVLYFKLKSFVSNKLQKFIFIFLISTCLSIITGAYYAPPLMLHAKQKRYKHKVIYDQQTKYQNIVITQWKDVYWLFINNNQQLSTFDEWLYHEPLVHPAMKMAQNPKDILVLGGGDGCAVREILKYKSVKKVRLIDLDPVMTDIGLKHPVFSEINNHAFEDQRVDIINMDAFAHLEEVKDFYDVIIIDFPDPKSIALSKLYCKEFYELCYTKLRPNGYVITQAGSPQFATKAFLCIEKTMQDAGFTTQNLHNNTITLGEWGWVIASKKNDPLFLQKLQSLNFENIDTRFINKESMKTMTSFGKPQIDTSGIQINTLSDPILSNYYLEGNWEMY